MRKVIYGETELKEIGEVLEKNDVVVIDEYFNMQKKSKKPTVFYKKVSRMFELSNGRHANPTQVVQVLEGANAPKIEKLVKSQQLNGGLYVHDLFEASSLGIPPLWIQALAAAREGYENRLLEAENLKATSLRKSRL